MAATDTAFQRGLRYLLAAQATDGSWHVRKRTHDVQPFYDSAFPHGVDQFISVSATSWATYALLRALPRFAHHGRPVLLGVSRKSFLGKLTGAESPADRLPGALACAALAVRDGVQILRAHDVRETVAAVRVAEAIASGT